jgi:hypothetical protein
MQITIDINPDRVLSVVREHHDVDESMLTEAVLDEVLSEDYLYGVLYWLEDKVDEDLRERVREVVLGE